MELFRTYFQYTSQRSLKQQKTCQLLGLFFFLVSHRVRSGYRLTFPSFTRVASVGLYYYLFGYFICLRRILGSQ